jgi:hypothetical protein
MNRLAQPIHAPHLPLSPRFGCLQAIPGFKRYAMEHLGGEACILGLLRSQPPLDPRDGGTMALLQVCVQRRRESRGLGEAGSGQANY